MKRITYLIALLFLGLWWNGNAQITSFPYSEDFESGDGGWVADNTTNGTWALGTPAASVINSAASGSNAWTTNLTGNYNNGENSFVESPVFDFSALNAPAIQFSIWWNAEFSWDGMVLQSSIDGGTSWQNVGAFGDPNNWYNDTTINGNPGGQQIGWTGRNSSNNGSGGWVTANNALTGLAGQSSVILRFAFGSDGSVNDNGVAFDLVNIFDVNCPAPTNLVANVNATNATLTWNAGGTESTWEYINQEAGNPAPTNDDTGTSVGATSAELNGLVEGATYNFYVRANCGSEFSVWSGPLVYSISGPGETCENPIVIPAALPYSTDDDTSNYGDDYSGGPGANCGSTSGYLGGDDVVYSYTPDNDGSITITMSPAGTWSGLFVYESCADIGTACTNGVANSGTGPREIVLPVTAGNTIYIVISTWPAPQSVAYNLTLTENTCTDPEATYAVVSDCANGEQFLIDVDITSLGSANTLSITDDQGNAPLSVDAVGTYSFGPYPNNTNVTITVSNDDDANCVISSAALTQEFCLDAVVDCTGGPLNVSYCYVNSDTNVFTYTSSDGSPLSLTINSGFVENTWDELIILDSDGVTNLNAATPYGAAGNIGGLTFQSTGDSISFWVQSDGSVSCSSSTTGNLPAGINYTVACATCVNPVATFNVVSDCLNAPQFFVEIDITDLGSAGSLTITDNQSSDPVVVTTAGLTSFGPYANLTEVVISVANDDDSNCVVNSNTLTQEFCIENTVDCTSGPINAFYCYGNNDTNVFQYTSSDGSPLNLVINSGNVENTWDELIILDSDGVTNLNAANPYGNAGNISGLTFQSTGDTIFFAISSDGIISCASSGAPLNQGINYTVSCATCINPQATYQVVDDCANGDQFLIDVNVTSLGDAESVTISDNQGSTPVSVNSTGITQFGPYPFLVDIVITISNDQDVNCVINSAPIQLLACPPANDNCEGATVATVNTADACDIVTPGTILAATPSGVPAGSCGGDPDDDVWFEFVAQDEVQIISLINIAGGTFNLDHAVYEGNCGNLTELYCSDGTSSVTPQLVVGNTYYIRVFSFGSVDETTSFDLCIRRAPTNIICDNAVNFCTDGEALVTSNIIGIPNTGQIACLFTAPNPTWNIIQIGDPGLIELEIAQTNEAGNGIDVDFVLWGPFSSLDDVCNGLDNGCPNPSDCPNNTTSPDFYPFGNIVDCSYSFISTETATINNAQTGEIYILLVTNFSNQPGTIAISQTNAGVGDSGSITAEIEAVIESEEVIFVDVDEDPSTPEVAEVCGFESVTIFANSPFADTFIWYKDGFVIEGETGPSLTVTESDNYQVQAFDEQCDTDAFSQIVDIRIYREAIANQPPNIVTCAEPGNNGAEDFDLDSQIPIILGDQDPSLFAVSFYASIADANQAINALTSPFDSEGQTIFVRVEDVAAAADGFLGCRSITQFELIISGPTPTATSVDFEVCDDISRDGIEIFDLSSHDAAILDGQDPAIFTVSYYLTQSDADAGTNAITSPYTNTSNPQTIFARVESNVAVDCYSITDFDLVVDAVPFATFNSNEVDYEVCPNATVPIEISLIPDGYSEEDVTIEWELDNAPFNEGNGLTIPVLVAGTYTAFITFNTTGCEFIVSTEVIELEQCVIPEGISPNNDGSNDRFDLSSFGVVKLEIFNRNGTLVYSKENYRDEWFGQTNKGENLPVGTYFYTMIYEGGAKKRSAWVYISR